MCEASLVALRVKVTSQGRGTEECWERGRVEHLMKGVVFLGDNEGFVSLFQNFLKINLWGGKQHLSDTLYAQAKTARSSRNSLSHYRPL